MEPITADIEQGSEAWLALRAGRATASEFDKVMAGKNTVGRKEYIWRLALERINGKPFESYKSADMDRGNELEDTARMRYTLATRQSVETAYFVQHPTLMAGASPDGYVGDDGLVEFKAPRRHNHGHVLKTGTVPSDYKWQVAGQQLMTGRKWTDFVSFSDEFPPNAALAIIRVERDEELIADLEHGLEVFLEEVERTVEFITNYGSQESTEKKV